MVVGKLPTKLIFVDKITYQLNSYKIYFVGNL